jgi:uracil-DNA glycosylase family 4
MDGNWMSQKVEQLKKIYQEIHRCSKCRNFQKGSIGDDPEKVQRKTIERSIDSEIFVVGQSLAEDQVRLSGVPYHYKNDKNGKLSRGGKFLEDYFNTDSIGYTLEPDKPNRKYVYTTDLVQCFPGKRADGRGHNKPTKQVIETCLNYWCIKELKIINPKVIILLGKLSAEAFFPYMMRKETDEFRNLRDLYLKKHDFQIGQKIYSVFVLPLPNSGVKGIREIYKETFQLIGNELNRSK